MTPFDLGFDRGDLPPAGAPTRRRLAVRAVVTRGDEWLLVRSAQVGDWKFPGGGVEAGETEEQALAREVAEETGYRLAGTVTFLGRTVERSPGREGPGTLFEMESRYFAVPVAGAEPGTPNLDAYERDLGFEARWVNPTTALAQNQRLARSGRASLPPWLERETAVLALLTRSAPLEGREPSLEV